MSESSSAKCRAIAAFLEERYGPIPWWGGTADEVMIGAILVHQTRWENVEGGLERLQTAGLGTLAAIGAADEDAVQAAIRCTGFYRVKTRRLKALAALVENLGGIEGMRSQPT
ncbi:MAG: Fe-S cluster assembly protein HesB, partial [Methanobacteriota archaeon]